MLRGAVAGLREIKRAVAGIADSLTAARAARCDQLLRQLGDVEASAHRLAFICEADQRYAPGDGRVGRDDPGGWCWCMHDWGSGVIAALMAAVMIHSVNTGWTGPTPADCVGWRHQCIPGRVEDRCCRR